MKTSKIFFKSGGKQGVLGTVPNTHTGIESEVAQMLAFTPTERFNHLNEFLKLSAAFRKDKINWPKGVFKFKTFEEADKWQFQVITGQRPGR